MAAAVDFDDQPLPRPAKVDLEAEERRVHERLGQRALHQRDERVFAAAPRSRAPTLVQLDRRVEHSKVLTPVGARHDVADRGLHESPAKRGLVQHIGQLELRQDVAEVDEQPVHRRHRDPAVGGDISRIERAIAMNPHAVELAPSRCDDMG